MGQKEFKVQRRDDPKSGDCTVTIKGDMGIQYISDITASLKRLEIAHENVTVRVTDIVNIDLSSIQVIRAFVQSLQADGKKVNIQFEATGEYLNLVKQSGFEKAMQVS